MAVDALLEVAGDAPRLLASIEFLRARLPGYATLWHLAGIARAPHPEAGLADFAAGLRERASMSVDAAVALLTARGDAVEAAPSSSLTRRVIAGLPPPAGRPAGVGLAGADAIGPHEVLNIVGTRDLAARLPTTVVTTSCRLVPSTVFSGLGSPLFERIPLDWFESVIIDGEVHSPAAAGARAAALAPQPGPR